MKLNKKMKKLLSVVFTFIIISFMLGWWYAGCCFEKKVQTLVAQCNRQDYLSCTIVHMQKWLFQATCDVSMQLKLAAHLRQEYPKWLENKLQATCHIVFNPWKRQTQCQVAIRSLPSESASLLLDEEFMHHALSAQGKIGLCIQHKPSWVFTSYAPWINLRVDPIQSCHIHLVDLSVHAKNIQKTIFSIENSWFDVQWSQDDQSNLELTIDWDASHLELKSELPEVQDYFNLYGYQSKAKTHISLNYR